MIKTIGDKTKVGSKKTLLLTGEQVLMSFCRTPACKHNCCSASTSDLIRCNDNDNDDDNHNNDNIQSTSDIQRHRRFTFADIRMYEYRMFIYTFARNIGLG